MYYMKKFHLIIFLFSLALFSGKLVAQEDSTNNSDILEIIKGDKNAPITLIEYASYTCPHCATFHKEVFKKIEKNYIETGKIRFIYREIYFDAPGLWAGLIARCKNNSRFFGIVDLLYQKQDDWALANSEKNIVEELIIIAKQAGIEKKEALNCLNDKEKALSLVDFMKINVERDNITSTPSFLINGELFSNMSYEELKENIDNLISKI